MLLARPRVCMGKDKDIQRIPENAGREDGRWRGRKRKKRRWGKGADMAPAELPNLFTRGTPLLTFFLGGGFTWQLLRTATLEPHRPNAFLKGILESFVVM